MKSTLQIISEAMVSESLDLLLIGGYGLQAYGVVRQTMDVDCLISQVDRDKLDTVLRTAGYESAGEVSRKDLEDACRRYGPEGIFAKLKDYRP